MRRLGPNAGAAWFRSHATLCRVSSGSAPAAGMVYGVEEGLRGSSASHS